MISKYPECEKMAAVKDKSQVIGEFLEWAGETQGLHMCANNTNCDRYTLVSMTREVLLAKFFDIDLNKVEKERRQMLDELRGKNE